MAPLQIISNLLEICHLASKINVIKSDPFIPEANQKKIENISNYGLPKLVKLWQVLIKSIEELRYAPNQEQSGSMTILKLCYTSSLPDPGELIEKLANQKINNEKKSEFKEPLKQESNLSIPDNSNTNKTVSPKNFDEMLNLLLVNDEALLLSLIHI